MAAEPASLTAKQGQKIRAHLDNGDLVGLVVVSVTGDSVVHRSFEQVSIDDSDEIIASSQFEIGSITKAFTNLLLAELVAKGVVRYDTAVADVMTDVTFDNPAVGEVTLLQLATHTSGLPRLPANLISQDPSDPYKDYDVEALYEGVKTTRAGQQLNQQYAYSNFGAGLLGHLLGAADGTDYERALRAHVLEPLGMTTATFDDTESPVPGHSMQTANWHLQALAAAGALRASGVELAKVLQPWLSPGFDSLQHDYSADLVVAASAGGNISISPVWHVVGADDSMVYWHNGGTGGYRSFVGFNPVTGKGRVVLSNSRFDVTQMGLQLLAAEPLERGQVRQNKSSGTATTTDTSPSRRNSY